MAILPIQSWGEIWAGFSPWGAGSVSSLFLPLPLSPGDTCSRPPLYSLHGEQTIEPLQVDTLAERLACLSVNLFFLQIPDFLFLRKLLTL